VIFFPFFLPHFWQLKTYKKNHPLKKKIDLGKKTKKKKKEAKHDYVLVYNQWMWKMKVECN
jgi:hypothetical protein